MLDTLRLFLYSGCKVDRKSTKKQKVDPKARAKKVHVHVIFTAMLYQAFQSQRIGSRPGCTNKLRRDLITK